MIATTQRAATERGSALISAVGIPDYASDVGRGGREGALGFGYRWGKSDVVPQYGTFLIW